MNSTAASGPPELAIGIQLYSLNAEMTADAPGTLRAIAEIGYTEVETAGNGSLRSAKELRAELDKNGLKCTSAHLQFDTNDLNKAFDDAHALGAEYATVSVPRMLLWPVVDVVYDLTPEQWTELINKVLAPMFPDEFKRTAEALNVVGEAAKAAGLKFAAHNHMMEMASVEGGTGWDYLIEHTEPGNVEFELDCGWATMMGQDAAGFIERHPGRITLLHAKDFQPHESAATPTFFSVRGAELGQGIMDYPKLFSRLQGKGIRHIYVEQDGPFDRVSAVEAARSNFAYLQALA